MKKFINNFLSHGEVAADYDKIMNSVLDMIFFMCSHKIYNKNEITKLIKTVNKLIYEQVTSTIGIKNNGDEPGITSANDEDEISFKSSVTYVLYVLNMWFFDSS